ncbi:MAG TPA: YggS family pyridoxal phosphate-dependent enzyme, partial [Bacillota bacterium]|nr:YggS family pyridoxal phosphate-dependent enzyme [Bacillota bacterium]
SFAKLRGLRDALSEVTKHEFPELSMGMSGDYHEAILEGATIVRVGTGVFGQR